MLDKKEIQEIIEKAENQKRELESLIKSLENVKVEDFGRVKNNEIYWFVNNGKLIDSDTESGHPIDNERYDCGNYYLIKEDAVRAEKQIRLFRLLDRFSRENGWDDNFWKDKRKEKWHIRFNRFENSGVIEPCLINYHRDIGQVYFISKDITNEAIEKFRDLIKDVI